jgi:hypothetical protein
MEFGRKFMHMNKEWNNVVFSDEKKFNLDDPNGFSSYSHDLPHNNPLRMSRSFRDGAVMVWTAFSAKSKTPICWITTKMESWDYANLLDDVLLTYLDEKIDRELPAADNAAIYKSGHSMEWFATKPIPIGRFVLQYIRMSWIYKRFHAANDTGITNRWFI